MCLLWRRWRRWWQRYGLMCSMSSLKIMVWIVTIDWFVHIIFSNMPSAPENVEKFTKKRKRNWIREWEWGKNPESMPLRTIINLVLIIFFFVLFEIEDDHFARTNTRFKTNAKSVKFPSHCGFEWNRGDITFCHSHHSHTNHSMINGIPSWAWSVWNNTLIHGTPYSRRAAMNWTIIKHCWFCAPKSNNSIFRIYHLCAVGVGMRILCINYNINSTRLIDLPTKWENIIHNEPYCSSVCCVCACACDFGINTIWRILFY